MRALIIACLVVGLALSAIPAMAEDAEALRRELEQMRRRFENSRQEYQKAIEAMGERLQRLEAAPQTVSTQPMVVQAPPTAPPPAPAQPAPITPMDLLRPREPFALAARTGGGRLLFDMGVAGDFVANRTQHNVDKADGGTFPGRENRLIPREIELSFFGQIDPYARGEVRLEAAEEFEDGARDIHVGLAEAHVTLLTVPYGFQPKLGLMRSRFGLLNQRHAHDLPQTDRPDVLVAFFGEEGLVESGLEVSWVAPLPFFLEALAGIFNGDNEDAFGKGSLRNPLVTGRLRTFFELGELGAIQLGASVANGQTDANRRQTFAGVDAKYKYTPEAWRHPLLTLGGEGIWSYRRITAEEEIDTDGDGVPDTTVESGSKTRERFGMYLWAEVQPWRQWALGVRYDNTQFLEDPGREWAIQPYVTFWPSEFLRFRLGYKHTERSSQTRDQFNLNGASARSVGEVFFQASFILGAHPAHPF
jgi:hypothetical protein